MKQIFSCMALITLIGATGCEQGTPGGQGTTNVSAKKPVFGQTDDTFNLSVPFMSTTLQQGETIEAEVGIEKQRTLAMTWNWRSRVCRKVSLFRPRRQRSATAK